MLLASEHPDSMKPRNSTHGGDRPDLTVDIDEVAHKSKSAAVVQTVSSQMGKSVDQMPPLREKIHPDALDNLFESTLTDPTVKETEVKFRYHGCWITISSTGTMELAFPPKTGVSTDDILGP